MIKLSVVFMVLALFAGEAQGVSLRNWQRARAGPAAVPATAAAAAATKTAVKPQFKQQATTEAALQTKQTRSQQELNHQIQLLNLEQQEAAALVTLKAKHLEREAVEKQMIRQRLVTAQTEAARLVADLAAVSKNKMLLDLQKLNSVIAHAMLPHAKSPVDTKLKQTKKHDPAAGSSEAAEVATASTLANPDVAAAAGMESDAKKSLHRQLVSKAADVVDAQLDSILNSDELAYIKAHNEQGDNDSDSPDNEEITEQDRDARPGETPDQHYKRLMKEADKLMADAYPHIRCEGMTGGGSSGAHTGATGSTGETNSTGESTAESTGAAGNSTTGEGLLEDGASGASGATAEGTAEGTAGTGETAAEGATAADTAAAAPTAEGTAPAGTGAETAAEGAAPGASSSTAS